MKNKIFVFLFSYLMFFLCLSLCNTIFYFIGIILNYLSGIDITPPEVKYYLGSAVISFFIAIYYVWSKNR